MTNKKDIQKPTKPDRKTQTFKVLIGCTNGKRYFEPGEKVTVKDFSIKVIERWLEQIPPVLEVVHGE